MPALARSRELMCRGAIENLGPLLPPPDDAGMVHGEFCGTAVVFVVFGKSDCCLLELKV